MTNKIAPAPWHLTGQGYVLAVYLPTRLITLAQDWHNTRFFFAPQANGHLKPALLKDYYINSQYFPDIAQGRVVACFKVTDFSLIFPVPKTQVL